ncbi:MAG: FHIPEP family type III secretion protein, partial [Candidatus Wukongarchaeota archaeon]|nr:FHIPEP family type III secretion protein [Candidatus Wukongarchaeota archaeon]
EKKLFTGRLEKLTSLAIPVEKTKHSLTGNEAWWIKQKDWETVEEAGLKLYDALEYLFWHLQAVLENNLSEFLGHQEVMELLDEKLTTGTHLKVLKNPNKPLDLSALVTVLKGLVREKVPITALEAIVKEFNHSKKNGMNLLEIVEKIRSIPEILPKLPGNNDQYSFYQIRPILEKEINRSIKRKHSQPILNMDPEMCRDALTAVRTKASYQRNMAILVRNPQIRPFIKQLIRLEFPEIPVLSRNELLPHLESKIAGEIDIA